MNNDGADGLKNDEDLSIRSLIFLRNAPSNSVLLAHRLSVRRFQMPLEGLSFVKTLATFASVDSPSIFLTINPVDHAELRAPIFQNQGRFPRVLYLKRSR